MDRMKISEIEAMLKEHRPCRHDISKCSVDYLEVIRQLLAERREMLKIIHKDHEEIFYLESNDADECDCPYCTETREVEQEAADGK